MHAHTCGAGVWQWSVVMPLYILHSADAWMLTPLIIMKVTSTEA